MSDLIDNQPDTTSITIRERRRPEPEAARRPPTILCAFCTAAIPTMDFAYLSKAKRLLSAECPECSRRTTLPVTEWARLSGWRSQVTT
jgi:hypothetical protein